MAKLFGFSIEDDDNLSPGVISPVPPNKEDGVDHYMASGFFGSYVDIEGVYRTEFDLIKRYREMALHPECDSAIEDIVNEAIVSDTNDSPIQIDLDNLNASDGLKKIIREEFKYILELLDFDKKSHEIYRNWYIDGRLYYHKVIDLKNPKEGIQELRYIDALKMRYVRQAKKKPEDKFRMSNKMVNNPMDYDFPEIEEYFIYEPKMTYPTGTPAPGGLGGSNSGIRMTKDSITYCTSGLVDRNKGSTLSYLHKAIKSLNQLRMIEDSLVIYRLCLVGDTRVKTNQGYSYIKDINVGDTVYAYDNNVNSLVETKVTNKWMTGVKPVYTVKSKHHKVTGTETHPVLVYDTVENDVKYVPIKDLVPKRHCLTYIKPEENNTISYFPEVRNKVYSLSNKKLWSSSTIKNKEKLIKDVGHKTGIKPTRIRNFLYGSQHIEEENLTKLKSNLALLENEKFNVKYEGFVTNELNLPDYITPEFSRLFGFLIGDGSVSNYSVVFAEGEDETQNLYYAGLMEKFFGNCKRHPLKNRRYVNYTTSNTLAAELLKKLGFISGAKNKRIPQWVFSSSNEIKKEFILGLLDADGHYKDLTNGFSCEISLCNKNLIEDIKEIWTSIGLCSGSIRHRIRKSTTRVIGEETEPRIMPETECWELYLSEYELPKFEKITSVEYTSTEEVYDIEVEHEKHNFVANGVIVHNSRAPERRIFYIDVGNLPKVKAEQYLRDVMMRYRNKMVYNACLSMDTKIPLLDGRTLTLAQITKEFNEGKRLWAYSCDPKTGKFAPGIISWAGVTRKNEKVMKITLDNDETITCTLDHKFPVWNKGKIEAKDLVVGDSMIPFYTRNKNIPGNKNSTYEQIFENESKKWLFTHRLVSRWKDFNNILNEYNFNPQRIDENKNTVHHKNYNRYDNCPENLVRMSKEDHFEYHKQHSSESGKKGGKVCAQRKRELGLPFFNMTKEERIENGKKSGSKGGKACVSRKSGIHGLPLEKIIENSKKGSKILGEKLRTDKEFREEFIKNVKNGWTEEARDLARERGKKLPDIHFERMNMLAIEALWGRENRKKNSERLSQKQTIQYNKEIYDLVEICARKNLKYQDALDYINKNLNFNEWAQINLNKTIRKGKGNCNPLTKFSYSNLIKVCKILGFTTWTEYKESFVYKNHKIKNIEFLDETIDVGTLSIDNDELYHNYHTFALESGIYTCNSTGEITDDKKHMAMLEDFWLPRREGGRGTEISTLPGGQNLGEITDINYFQKKLYRSLNVPPSRMDGEGGFNLGRSSEILRDEVKFTKFVARLRKRFSFMFSDMLRTQLLLKNIITPEDWKVMGEHIQYDFLYDNHFSELKDAELLNERLNMVQVAEPYVGKYFSQDYIRRKVLRQTDAEILEEDKKIKKEIKNGVIPDPNAAPIDPETGMPMEPNAQMNLGQPVMEPDLRSQERTVKTDAKPVEMPKGGEI